MSQRVRISVGSANASISRLVVLDALTVPAACSLACDGMQVADGTLGNQP